jgi:membrane-bound hydrogenase subunit mbhJ
MLANFCKKMFGRSLWVYHCNSGACNGCDIEILDILTPFYDVERFGIKLVPSPRHADVMLISGAVTRPTLPLVRRAYEAMPAPKLVFGIGSCATGGGAWFNYFIPGCPPRPEAIVYGVALALGLVDKKAMPIELKQIEFPIDVYERNEAYKNRNAIYELVR